MPTDLALPFSFDASGDIGTVSGDSFYEQHVQILALIVAENVSGESLSRSEQIRIESRLEELLVASPFIDGPVSVTVEDSRDTTFKATVRVGEITPFEITA
jgi:hypothetical protein